MDVPRKLQNVLCIQGNNRKLCNKFLAVFAQSGKLPGVVKPTVKMLFFTTERTDWHGEKSVLTRVTRGELNYFQIEHR